MSDEHGSDFVDELMEFLLRNYYSMMIKRVKKIFSKQVRCGRYRYRNHNSAARKQKCRCSA